MINVNMTISSDLALDNCPPPLGREIMAQLTIPNPKYAEAIQQGRWTGEIPQSLELYKFDSDGRLRLPRGFGPEFHHIAHKQGIWPLYEDHRRTMEPVVYKFKGKLRPYQRDAVVDIERSCSGVLEAGTGSGKTVMALKILADRAQPCLILVHTRELLNQWVERIDQFLGVRAGRVGGGKYDVQSVTVATVQTARRHLSELVPMFGHVVVDECHRCPSSTFLEVVSTFDSKYMLGLTATPYRRDRLDKMIFWALGDVVHRVDPEHLRKTGAVLQPEIVPLKTSYQFWGDPSSQYSKMISHLTLDMERNQLIVSTVLQEVRRQGGTILLLSDRTAHLEALAGLLREQGQAVSILTGQTRKKQRGQIVGDLAAGRVKILASTMSLIGEGFDCPGLSTLVLASPIKWRGRLIQVAGRVLRPMAGKRPRIIDVVDGKEPVLKASYRAREREYRRLTA